MNRLEQTFTSLKESNRKAFVPYIMAGDGGLETLKDRLVMLERFGASAIELGVPFSDPVADGPTIQSAGLRALANGTTLKGIITQLASIRESVSIPILLMTYINPIYAYGIEKFVEDISKVGVDGCIIPDLPVEEEELVAPQLSEKNIELIRFVTLTTPIERIKQITNLGKGFVYTVTVKGITGTRKGYDAELHQFLKTVKAVSPIPVIAGFGISSEDQIRELTEFCDGVIVGSKIVEFFKNNQLDELESFMSVLKQETKIV